MLKHFKNIISFNGRVIYSHSRVEYIRTWAVELDCLGSFPVLLARCVGLGKLFSYSKSLNWVVVRIRCEDAYKHKE